MPIKGRIKKAQRFLEAAHHAWGSGDYESSVSRAYYACYHAVVIMVEAEGGTQPRQRWDHVELHKAFLDQFCKKGLHFAGRDGETFGEMMHERLIADYGLETFNKKRAERLLTKASELVGKIRRVLGYEEG